MAGGTRRVLDRPVFANRARRDIFPIRRKRKAQGGRDAGGEALVGVRRWPELVVEVHCPREAQLPGVSELAEKMDERDRVRSAGQRRDDAGVWTAQIMLADELANAFDD